MSKLVFELPNAQTPGYLRRVKKGMELADRMQDKKASPSSIDDMVEFLLPYITEPKDREEARDTLLDASQEQFMVLVKAVSGESEEENPTVDGKPSTKSEPLEKD